MRLPWISLSSTARTAALHMSGQAAAVKQALRSEFGLSREPRVRSDYGRTVVELRGCGVTQRPIGEQIEIARAAAELSRRHLRGSRALVIAFIDGVDIGECAATQTTEVLFPAHTAGQVESA